MIVLISDLADKANIKFGTSGLRGGWKSEKTALRYLRNWDDSDWLLVSEAWTMRNDQ